VQTKLAQHGLSIRGGAHPIDGWIADPHDQTEWVNRFNVGCPMMGQYIEGKIRYENPELYLLKNSIPLMRKFIDMRWLKVTPNCTGFIGEISVYSLVRLPDGTHKDDPEKKNDHGPDGCRYGLIMIFPAQGYASFDSIRETSSTIQSSPVQTITGGIMAKRF
jgi:hypothetical protein